jgi:hypothetical protein
MSKPSKPRLPSKTCRDAPAAAAAEPTSTSAASPAPATPAAAGPIDADTLDEAFIKALEDDFIQHGAATIAAIRSDKPTDYVKIVAALRAKEANDAIDPLRKMSDAELDRRIEELAACAGYEIRRVASPATEPGEG